MGSLLIIDEDANGRGQYGVLTCVSPRVTSRMLVPSAEDDERGVLMKNKTLD